MKNKDSLLTEFCIDPIGNAMISEIVKAVPVKDIRRLLKHYLDNKEVFDDVACIVKNGVAYSTGMPNWNERVAAVMASEAIPQTVKNRICLEVVRGGITIPKRSPSPTFIYLMLDHRTKAIKIGRSKNPSLRESTLQAEQPDITLIDSWPGMEDDEVALHAKFAGKRRRGEWFNLSDADVEDIRSYMTGRNSK